MWYFPTSQKKQEIWPKIGHSVPWRDKTSLKNYVLKYFPQSLSWLWRFLVCSWRCPYRQAAGHSQGFFPLFENFSWMILKMRTFNGINVVHLGKLKFMHPILIPPGKPSQICYLVRGKAAEMNSARRNQRFWGNISCKAIEQIQKLFFDKIKVFFFPEKYSLYM